jgi:DNA invertase Pin-like site-specific DNA recombinase
MRAAIYARKSTDEAGVADDAKSVSRQIDRARQFAESRGWTVDDAHVYVDDGIGGAEFAKRAGLQRLLSAVGRSGFDAVIVSEASRLGRESLETGYVMKQIMRAGVRLFSYLDGREIKVENAVDKAVLAIQGMADEMERERARQRTYDALERKAREGHVTGGRTFGYTNVEIADATGKRSHVVHEVNATEAAVVRRIFELYDSGFGFTKIAKTLNAEGAATPRSQRGRPAGWASSSVREVLRRPLYAGRRVWGRTKKRNQWGQVEQRPRPEAEWLTVPDDSVRIVDEALWLRVQQRLEMQRARCGPKGGRTRGAGAKYLLTGLVRCGMCGSGLEVRSRPGGDGRRVFFYECSGFRRKGKTVCTNRLIIASERLHDAVITELADRLLQTAVIEAAIERAAEHLASTRGPDTREALAERLALLDREVGNLVSAIATCGISPALQSALTAKERERAELRVRAEALAHPVAYGTDADTLTELEAITTEWRSALRENPAEAQGLLAVLIGDDRLTATPDANSRAYTITGSGNLETLVARVGRTKPLFPVGTPSR